MKDSTLLTAVISVCLTAIAIGCLVTGHNNGLLSTIISALSAFVGVGIGRAMKSEEIVGEIAEG